MNSVYQQARDLSAESSRPKAEPSGILIEKLTTASSVCVLTGAGISVESGLSTFRDPDGLWQRYRPEDLASEGAFRRNPSLVQNWYALRREQALAASPNPGHSALVQMEALFDDFLLVTQNVDTLHTRAGTQNQVEVHGNIRDEHCIECGLKADEVEFKEGGLRTCHQCGGLLRPSVVWFGEQLPERAFRQATEAAGRADVFLSVGTSSIVYPAAGLPLLARHNGSYLVEINVEPSALSQEMDEVLLGPAGVVLPDLLTRIRSKIKTQIQSSKYRADLKRVPTELELNMNR